MISTIRRLLEDAERDRAAADGGAVETADTSRKVLAATMFREVERRLAEVRRLCPGLDGVQLSPEAEAVSRLVGGVGEDVFTSRRYGARSPGR